MIKLTILGEPHSKANSLNIGKWTDAEISFLVEEYPNKGKEYCAEKLNRTHHSIRMKAYCLGLKQNRKSEFFADWQKRAAKNKNGDVWPDGHIKFIKENYKEFGRIGVAKALNRTPKSVQVKASRLGLIQSNECTYKNKIKAWSKIPVIRQQELRQERSDSMSLRQSRGELRNGYSRGMQGRRSDLGGLFVRSSWEANYARYLNWLVSKNKIYRWEYEPDTFWFLEIKRGVRSYKPDFKIWDEINSVPYYVEVKGWMDKKSKTKLSRMEKYYPEVRVDVVDQKEYNAIKRQICKVIECWE